MKSQNEVLHCILITHVEETPFDTNNTSACILLRVSFKGHSQSPSGRRLIPLIRQVIHVDRYKLLCSYCHMYCLIETPQDTTC